MSWILLICKMKYGLLFVVWKRIDMKMVIGVGGLVVNIVVIGLYCMLFVFLILFMSRVIVYLM